jgi:hypothetical protein
MEVALWRMPEWVPCIFAETRMGVATVRTDPPDAFALWKEYAPDLEPSLLHLLRRPDPGRLPERRFREVEELLGVSSPRPAVRAALYDTLWSFVNASPVFAASKPDWRVQDRLREGRKRRIAETAASLVTLLTDSQEGRENITEADLAAVRRDLECYFPYPRVPGGRPIEAAIQGLRSFADIARRAASPIGKPAGRPVDQANRRLLRNLGAIFAAATETLPARGTDKYGEPSSPFLSFVTYVYDWLGPPWSEKSANGINSDVQRHVDAEFPFIMPR